MLDTVTTYEFLVVVPVTTVTKSAVVYVGERVGEAVGALLGDADGFGVGLSSV